MNSRYRSTYVGILDLHIFGFSIRYFQIDGINTLKTEVLDLSNSVAFNTTNINKLTTATAHEANNLIGMPKDYGLPKSK